MPKTGKPTDAEVIRSCQDFLGKILPRLAEGSVVSPHSVGMDNREFRKNSDRLLKALAQARACLQLLDLPLPVLRRRGDRKDQQIEAAIRPFARQVAAARQNIARRLLAMALLNAQRDGEYLIPRGNETIFLGFGTTAKIVGDALLFHLDADANEFLNIRLSTSNVEVFTTFYHAAPRAFARDTRERLYLQNCYVDWKYGGAYSTGPVIPEVSVVGFEGIKNSQVQADEGKKATALESVLAATTHRIIVIGEKEKLNSGGSRPLTFPKERTVLLCTDCPDDEVPDEVKQAPGLEHVSLAAEVEKIRNAAQQDTALQEWLSWDESDVTGAPTEAC